MSTLVIFYRESETAIGTVSLVDGVVTSTGVGGDVAAIPVLAPDRSGRRLTPDDGLDWLRGIIDEVTRSGYYGARLIE